MKPYRSKFTEDQEEITLDDTTILQNALLTAITSWNTTADRFNQWDTLGWDEKLELIRKELEKNETI